MLINWGLYILLVVLLLGFILAEHQAAWVQLLLGIPAIGAGLAIFARKLHPKLFSADDRLPPLKQYGITIGVVIALIVVIGGGAIYMDTYHHPDRALTETEKLVGKGIFYSIIGIPIMIALLLRRLMRRS